MLGTEFRPTQIKVSLVTSSTLDHPCVYMNMILLLYFLAKRFETMSNSLSLYHADSFTRIWLDENKLDKDLSMTYDQNISSKYNLLSIKVLYCYGLVIIFFKI